MALPAAGTLVVDQVRSGDDGRLDAAHLEGALDRLADALLGKREAGLHLRPRIAVPSPVEHRYPLGNVVRGEIVDGRFAAFLSQAILRAPKALWENVGLNADGKGQPGQLNAMSHGCAPARFRQINVLKTE